VNPVDSRTADNGILANNAATIHAFASFPYAGHWFSNVPNHMIIVWPAIQLF